MNIKSFIPFILICSFTFCFTSQSKGQNLYKIHNIDSAAIQKRVLNEYDKRDSILNDMKSKRIKDSIARAIEKIKIQNYRDSIANARIQKRIQDSTNRSLAQIKIIRDRIVKDSLELIKRKKLKDSLDYIVFKRDSIREAEINNRNLQNLARQKTTDSINAIRKHQADSLKVVRLQQQKDRDEFVKYTHSKHYKDSVANSRKNKQDSIKNERLAIQEKIKQDRERINDSIRNRLQGINDSIALVRNKTNDSLKQAVQTQNEKLKNDRLRIKDSLLALREKNDNKSKDGTNIKKTPKEKAAEAEKKKLAIAIKLHEKKKEEWSNDKFLKRKWNLPRRIIQNTFTRYNYHYHAKRKYVEAIDKITKNNSEDFTKNISLLPYNTAKDGNSITSEMDTVIKKSSFGTQIHDPRSKWFDNLYFLMGKASYTKNDFESAIQTFQFIANEYKISSNKKSKSKIQNNSPINIATIENRKGLRKLSHHPIRNEALIWLAKSYIMAEQYANASSLLETLQKDKNLPKRYADDLLIAKSLLSLQQNDSKNAVESLELLLKEKNTKKQKSRTEFLLGQLYAENKEFEKSSEHFKKSITGKNNPEMDFYTKLNIAINASKGGGDKEYAKTSLQKIISDARFAKYKSEALNILAAIEAEENMAKAADLLKKSINNTDNKDLKQKAIAYASLGNIYYKLSEYELSKNAYDSAAFYGSNPPIEQLDIVLLRKDVLSEIVNYLRIIHKQDSMINLSTKSEKEQKAAAKRELDKLKKKHQEQQITPNELQVVALQPSGGALKSNWYFYNNNLLQKGTTEFKQKWGNRKLEDNWRRSTATNNINFVNDEDEVGGDEKENINGVSLNLLMSYIPKTKSQLDIAHNNIQDAYYNLGLTYYTHLNDYYNSIKTFDTLIKRYPNSSYKQQSYYALYLNYDKLNQKVAAQKYKNLLFDEFGQSEFALLANNPNYTEQLKNKAKDIEIHYENTYQIYKDRKYREAIDRVLYAKTAYKKNPYQAKYALVEAVSEAGLNDISKCKLILQDIITQYPNTEEQTRAQEILNMILSQKDNDSNKINDYVKPTLNRYDDSLEASNAFKELRTYDGKGNFTTANDEMHYVMIFVKNVDGRTMALKAAMSDYNLLKNSLKEYTTGLNLLTAQQGILTIKQFTNLTYAKKYLTEISKEKNLFTQLRKDEYELSVITIENYGELLKSRDILGYIKFYKKNY